MKPLLVLVATAGVPLCALAQPAAKTPELTITAMRQCPDAGNPHLLDAVRRVFDAPPESKRKRTEESAGTRAFVLMKIAGFQNNNTDYTHMSPGLARLAREQFPRNRPRVVCQGVLKGIRFLHVSQVGWDVFEVDFSNGALEWAVMPFDPHQVTDGAAWRYFYPQPATKSFEAWLKSLERGRPNYANLAPDAKAKLQAQWPVLQTSLKTWGGLQGFRFLRRQGDGAYVYLATYERRLVVWTVLPSQADGYFTTLTYDELAG